MQLKLNKRYRCRNGETVTIVGVEDYERRWWGESGAGMSKMRICYYPTGRIVPKQDGGWDITGPAEPELMFSFKMPVPTVSETEIKAVIADARRGPLWRKDQQELLAAAAERMIEMAKAPARKLDSRLPIRPQIAMLLEAVGLDPDRFLKPRPESSPFQTETKPMCDPEKIDRANKKAAAAGAAADLAKMLKEDLGVEVTPILLRLWLNERWEKVADLAHKIHGG